MVESVIRPTNRNRNILLRILAIIVGVVLLLTLIGFLTWRFGTLNSGITTVNVGTVTTVNSGITN